MDKVPNRYEVWVFYDPVCGRPDWFKESDCHSLKEVVDVLKKTMMYYHDDLKHLDEYVKVKAFQKRVEIKDFSKKPSEIFREFDDKLATMMDEFMEKCENCVMNDQIEENATDEDGRSVWICREGKPWFCKGECKYYIYDPFQENLMMNFYCEDVSEYIPLIREEMKKECENEK